MATDFYGRMRGTASRLLARFQQGDVDHVRVTFGTPANPWEPAPETETTQEMAAIARGVSQQYVAAGTARDGDLEVVAAVPATLPKLGDMVAVDGRRMSIVQVLPIPAAGIPCALRLIVRD